MAEPSAGDEPDGVRSLLINLLANDALRPNGVDGVRECEDDMWEGWCEAEVGLKAC